MGEAKTRGTFEERVQRAKEADDRVQNVQKIIKREVALPPKFIKFEIVLNAELKQGALLLVDTKHNCVLDQMLFPHAMVTMEQERCVRVFNTALKMENVI